MAVRKSINQIAKDLQTKVSEAGEYWLERQPAEMGNHAGVVSVPNTENMVYVRLQNGQVIQVFNSMAPNIYNWKVYIGRDKSQPSLLKVVEVRWVHNITQTVAYVLFHHKQHEYPGPDTVWIMRDQFLPLLVLPAGGFTVRLYGDVVFMAGMAAPVVVENSESIDLSSHVVAVGARYVLMEVLQDGTLNYIDGDLYDSLIVLRETGSIPAPTAGAFPVAAFEFYEGQTELRRDSTDRNVIDLRMFVSNVSLDPAAEWHTATATTTLAAGDEFGIWQAASSAIRKITWASIKAVLDGLYDALGSAAAVTAALNDHLADAVDAHDASAISIADAGAYYTGTTVESALQEIGAGGIGGGGGADPLTYEDITSQIPAVGDHYDLSAAATSDVLLFYNGVLQPTTEFTMDGDNLGLTTDTFSPAAGDTLVVIFGSLAAGGGGTGEVPPALKVYTNTNFR